MEMIKLFAVFAIVVVFSALVFWSMAHAHKEREAKAQMAQTLGLAPVEPDAELFAKISALYKTSWSTPRHSLRNVTRRALPDGELFLFDLVDRDVESDSWVEKQAVAIRSARLHLPMFALYPKIDTEKFVLGGLANKIIAWGVSKAGVPVAFPEFPDLEARYLVTAQEPETVRRFFDARMARYFAETEYYTLRGGGDLFTFAEIEPGFKVNDPAHMTRRINRALEIYRLFQG